MNDLCRGWERRSGVPPWFIDLCEPVLAVGQRDVLEPVLNWLARAGGSGSGPDALPGFAITDDAWITAAAGIVAAGVAALGGRPRDPLPHDPRAYGSLPLGSLLTELHLALPLLRVVAGGCRRGAVQRLPLPTVVGDRRDLWRVARDVIVADLEGGPGAARDLAASRTAQAYREAIVSGEFLDGCAPELRPAWAVVAARQSCLTGDLELARVARHELGPHRDRFALLGRLLPIGPVGWFLADVEQLLGNGEAAWEANGLAERVSRRAGAQVWTARCRLQRRRLPARGTDPGTRPRPAASPPPGAARPLPAVPDRLSPRQHRILELAAAGLTNVQIARELYLSVATVERHCTLAYRALGVRNRAQALTLLAAFGGDGSVS